MCAQCMTTAVTAGATVSGMRAIVAAKHFAWLTPSRLRAITIALVAAGLAVSALIVSGTN